MLIPRPHTALTPSQRGQQILHRGVIPERPADMAEPVDVPRPENKAAAKLKRILAQALLSVARGPRPLAGDLVIASQHVQHVRVPQPGRAVGLALFVDQQGEANVRFLPEQACVVGIA